MANVTELIMTMVAAISSMWPQQANVSDGCAFDFVIIGSGAGAVLANRLTERTDFSVLLIEAGDNPSDESRIPADFPALPNTRMDWNYTSAIEPASASQETNRFRISSGKVLGGSSAINHQLHLRGVPNDFDYIAELLGDSSWKYDNMLHYFKKSENYKDAAVMNSNFSIFHGDAGPVNITRQVSNITAEYINAFAELGYPINLDLNSDNLTGYGDIPYIINLVRQDTAGTYILSARNRSNLHILRNAFVTKVIIEDNVAKGVEVDLENGESIKILANKEVLLCGGVVGSPKLLMTSGVGPKELLESLNISVISDLPVGYNLQEHVAVPIVHKMDYSTAATTTTTPDQLFPIVVGSVIIDENQTNPQYQTINLSFEHDTGYIMAACSTIFGIKTEICEMFVNETTGRNSFFSLVGIYNPDSCGSVAIQSADPYVDPIIHMDFYSNTKDLTNMVRYMEDFLRIINSTLFQEAGAEVILPEFSNCTGSYLECYAMSMSVNLYHPTSTCPMGTVLDANANVKGVDRLRVVDGSMLPKIPTANPLAAIIAAAEKIADVIKNDYSIS